MTITELETAVAAWLNAVKGARVLVKARIGEAPAPATPYLMYSVDVLQLPDFTDSTDDGTTQTTSARAVPIEIAIQVVGDILNTAHSARNDAAAILLSLKHSQRTTDIRSVAGLMGTGPIRNMTALEVGTLRQRWDTRVMLSATLTDSTVSEAISSVGTGVFEHTIPTHFTLNTTEP